MDSSRQIHYNNNRHVSSLISDRDRFAGQSECRYMNLRSDGETPDSEKEFNATSRPITSFSHIWTHNDGHNYYDNRNHRAFDKVDPVNDSRNHRARDKVDPVNYSRNHRAFDKVDPAKDSHNHRPFDKVEPVPGMRIKVNCDSPLISNNQQLDSVHSMHENGKAFDNRDDVYDQRGCPKFVPTATDSTGDHQSLVFSPRSPEYLSFSSVLYAEQREKTSPSTKDEDDEEDVPPPLPASRPPTTPTSCLEPAPYLPINIETSSGSLNGELLTHSGVTTPCFSVVSCSFDSEDETSKTLSEFGTEENIPEGPGISGDDAVFHGPPKRNNFENIGEYDSLRINNKDNSSSGVASTGAAPLPSNPSPHPSIGLLRFQRSYRGEEVVDNSKSVNECNRIFSTNRQDIGEGGRGEGGGGRGDEEEVSHQSYQLPTNKPRLMTLPSQQLLSIYDRQTNFLTRPKSAGQPNNSKDSTTTTAKERFQATHNESPILTTSSSSHGYQRRAPSPAQTFKRHGSDNRLPVTSDFRPSSTLDETSKTNISASIVRPDRIPISIVPVVRSIRQHQSPSSDSADELKLARESEKCRVDNRTRFSYDAGPPELNLATTVESSHERPVTVSKITSESQKQNVSRYETPGSKRTDNLDSRRFRQCTETSEDEHRDKSKRHESDQRDHRNDHGLRVRDPNVHEHAVKGRDLKDTFRNASYVDHQLAGCLPSKNTSGRSDPVERISQSSEHGHAITSKDRGNQRSVGQSDQSDKSKSLTRGHVRESSFEQLEKKLRDDARGRIRKLLVSPGISQSSHVSPTITSVSSLPVIAKPKPSTGALLTKDERKSVPYEAVISPRFRFKSPTTEFMSPLWGDASACSKPRTTSVDDPCYWGTRSLPRNMGSINRWSVSTSGDFNAREGDASDERVSYSSTESSLPSVSSARDCYLGRQEDGHYSKNPEMFQATRITSANTCFDIDSRSETNSVHDSHPKPFISPPAKARPSSLLNSRIKVSSAPVPNIPPELYSPSFSPVIPPSLPCSDPRVAPLNGHTLPDIYSPNTTLFLRASVAPPLHFHPFVKVNHDLPPPPPASDAPYLHSANDLPSNSANYNPPTRAILPKTLPFSSALPVTSISISPRTSASSNLPVPPSQDPGSSTFVSPRHRLLSSNSTQASASHAVPARSSPLKTQTSSGSLPDRRAFPCLAHSPVIHSTASVASLQYHPVVSDPNCDPDVPPPLPAVAPPPSFPTASWARPSHVALPGDLFSVAKVNSDLKHHMSSTNPTSVFPSPMSRNYTKTLVATNEKRIQKTNEDTYLPGVRTHERPGDKTLKGSEPDKSFTYFPISNSRAGSGRERDPGKTPSSFYRSSLSISLIPFVDLDDDDTGSVRVNSQISEEGAWIGDMAANGLCVNQLQSIDQTGAKVNHLQSTASSGSIVNHLESTAQTGSTFNHLQSSASSGSSNNHLESTAQAGYKVNHLQSTVPSGSKVNHLQSTAPSGSKVNHLQSTAPSGSKVNHLQSTAPSGSKVNHLQSTAPSGSKVNHLQSTAPSGSKVNHLQSTAPSGSKVNHLQSTAQLPRTTDSSGGYASRPGTESTPCPSTFVGKPTGTDGCMRTSFERIGESEPPMPTVRACSELPKPEVSGQYPVGNGDSSLLEIDIVKGRIGICFCLEGGRDSPYGDGPIRIKRIFHGTPDFSIGKERLRPGDELISVNGEDLTAATHYTAWTFLRTLPEGLIRLVVRRNPHHQHATSDP